MISDCVISYVSSLLTFRLSALLAAQDEQDFFLVCEVCVALMWMTCKLLSAALILLGMPHRLSLPSLMHFNSWWEVPGLTKWSLACLRGEYDIAFQSAPVISRPLLSSRGATLMVPYRSEIDEISLSVHFKV